MKTPTQRHVLMDRLSTVLGKNWFLRTTEAFGIGGNGIWTTNEQAAPNGIPLYDNETMETNPLIAGLLKSAGWYIEPYDSGTLMIYPE